MELVETQSYKKKKKKTCGIFLKCTHYFERQNNSRNVDIRRLSMLLGVQISYLFLFPYGINTASNLWVNCFGQSSMCVHAGPTLVLSASFISAGNNPLKLNLTCHSCLFSINPILLYFFVFSKVSIRGITVFGKNHFIEYLTTGFPPTPSQGEPGNRGKCSCIQHLTEVMQREMLFPSYSFPHLIVLSDKWIGLGWTHPDIEEKVLYVDKRMTL